jgi:hypothetical protein
MLLRSDWGFWRSGWRVDHSSFLNGRSTSAPSINIDEAPKPQSTPTRWCADALAKDDCHDPFSPPCRQDRPDHRGTSGIGLATARRFIEEGARVAITGTSADKLAAARPRWAMC